jgi:hypothetical protein
MRGRGQEAFGIKFCTLEKVPAKQKANVKNILIFGDTYENI